MNLEQIILRCFQHIQGQRSSSSIYHILKGKRSIQSIQDAHIFTLDKYYGIYKNLSKSEFNTKIQQLVDECLLKNEKESVFVVTREGIEWLCQNSNELYFNGLAYFEKADMFTERLLLLIQTLTNSKMNYYSFIPVVNNIEVERWVKGVYNKVKGTESTVLNRLYEEVQGILTKFTECEANMFVDRLSGYKTYGLSLFQIEERYGLAKDNAFLILCSITHRMLHIIEKNESTYPILFFLINNQSEVPYLTKSATQTYQYFLEGYSAEEIAKMRRLRENTIYDHLVEIALYHDDFPLRNYVTEKEQKQIMDAMKQANSQRLKTIKSLLDDHIHYFQIRLVMAIVNRKNKGDW